MLKLHVIHFVILDTNVILHFNFDCLFVLLNHLLSNIRD